MSTHHRVLGPSTQRLGRLREALWHKWSQLDAAWQNHNPADGNMDTKVLAKLDKIVEATKVAVSHALRISGDSLRVEWRTNSFEPVARRTTYRVSEQDRESSSPGGNDEKAKYENHPGMLYAPQFCWMNRRMKTRPR